MRRLLRGVALVLSLVILGGCSKKPDEKSPESKISKANFDKLETDMTEEKVVEILGKATEAEEADTAKLKDLLPGAPGVPGLKGKISVWKSGDKSIRVVFKDGKVYEKKQTGL